MNTSEADQLKRKLESLTATTQNPNVYFNKLSNKTRSNLVGTSLYHSGSSQCLDVYFLTLGS